MMVRKSVRGCGFGFDRYGEMTPMTTMTTMVCARRIQGGRLELGPLLEQVRPYPIGVVEH